MLYLSKDAMVSQSLPDTICRGCHYWLRFAITWRKTFVGFPVVQVRCHVDILTLVAMGHVC